MTSSALGSSRTIERLLTFDMPNNLFLPAITGQFGIWRYYQVIIPVSDLVGVLQPQSGDKIAYRVRTVDEVEEIYSKDINAMLQRVFDPLRLEPIKNYLLRQPDRYVNNLTIALYSGDPEWLPMDVTPVSGRSLQDPDKDALRTLEKSFGVIRLTGNEILFALDGQHRLKALRAAVKNRPKLDRDEVSVTLISHKPTEDGKKKTRRLFTTVNRYAKPVSLGESILLDEDDVSAILVRRLIQNYSHFKGRDLIAFNKTADLKLPKDADKFSTTVALWSINELLVNKDIYPRYDGSARNLVRVRPEDSVILQQEHRVWTFWNTFFHLFPKALEFVRHPEVKTRDEAGPFSLRPLGQQIFAEYYLRARSIEGFVIEKIKSVPDDLANRFWAGVLYNKQTNTILKASSFGRDYLFHHLGIPLNKTQQDRLRKNLWKHCEISKLPRPLFA